MDLSTAHPGMKFANAALAILLHGAARVRAVFRWLLTQVNAAAVPAATMPGTGARSMDRMDGIERAFISLAVVSFITLIAGVVLLAVR
jgi:hypothetical protein